MSKPMPINQLINLLFTQVTKPDGRPYTAAEVAQATGVSTSMISALRTGRRQNPSLDLARDILKFFDVPLVYLDATSMDEALEIIQNRAQATKGKGSLIFRDATNGLGLSLQALEQIEAVVEYIIERKKAQEMGLPEPEKPDFEDDDG
jgi:transcriptional regulator with XRE-family HTH domain